VIPLVILLVRRGVALFVCRLKIGDEVGGTRAGKKRRKRVDVNRCDMNSIVAGIDLGDRRVSCVCAFGGASNQI
jgi:hypothetical protein